MGCDIHMRIERKEEGKWTYFPCFYTFRDASDKFECIRVRRDYALFSLLANVRTHRCFYPGCISQPRGWPEDADTLTLSKSIYGDGVDYLSFKDMCEHSQSWLLLAEILDYIDTSPEKWGRKTRLRLERIAQIEEIDFDWLEPIKKIDEDSKNIRLIFGFDS